MINACWRYYHGMKKATIYHNPRCSKSRQTLELLQQHELAINVVEYLQTPPDQQQLDELLQALNCQPRDLMRKSEAEYKELSLDDDSLSREQLIAAMVENPRLIERPIVSVGGKVAVGRPPENILSIL